MPGYPEEFMAKNRKLNSRHGPVTEDNGWAPMPDGTWQKRVSPKEVLVQRGDGTIVTRYQGSAEPGRAGFTSSKWTRNALMTLAIEQGIRVKPAGRSG